MNKKIFLLIFFALLGLSFAGKCDAACVDPTSQACQQCLSGAGAGDGGGVNPAGGGAVGGDAISKALLDLCKTIKNALAVGMMFMVVTAALVYAIGQTMGAETRARATVWATSMFNGAIIAALILLIVPSVLQTLLGGTGIEGNITC